MTAPPCEVWFYHLERSGLDAVLPALLEKVIERGWRALVRSPDADGLQRLDATLWAGREDAFLPHGLASEPHAERQPILLSIGAGNPNHADALILLDGAEPGDLAGFERCILVFDGHDEAGVARARERWRDLKAAGHAASYWRQKEAGGWERSA